MIRLAPRPDAPARLASVAKERTDALAAQRTALEAGGVEFPNDYGKPEVKSALKAWQRGKCAFCEQRVDASQYGDVEHFRPKAAVLDERTQRLVRPGWWWLTYAWSNLFYACQLCNQAFKKNRFPLAPEGRRAMSPDDDLEAELPLLLDPAVDEVERHLGFERDVAVGHDARGAATIEILGLYREPLRERRLDLANQVTLLEALWSRGVMTPTESAKLRLLALPDREFTAMVRALLPPELLEPAAADVEP